MSISQEIAALVSNKTYTSSSHKAVVTRKSRDGTVWVHIAGGARETPISTTYSSAEVGDVVRVTISGGRADIVGNASSPTTNESTVERFADRVERRARDAEAKAGAALDKSGKAYDLAAEAKESADSATRIKSDTTWADLFE